MYKKHNDLGFLFRYLTNKRLSAVKRFVGGTEGVATPIKSLLKWSFRDFDIPIEYAQGSVDIVLKNFIEAHLFDDITFNCKI